MSLEQRQAETDAAEDAKTDTNKLIWLIAGFIGIILENSIFARGLDEKGCIFPAFRCSDSCIECGYADAVLSAAGLGRS